MFFRLALLFVLVPLIELALLIQMGRWVGVLPTVALVIFTGVLGAALARLQGLATLARFQRALAEGRVPHREMVEGILVLVAGAVLLTPGLLTDITGFLLLAPPVRKAAAARVLRWLQGRARVVVAGRQPGQPGERAGRARPGEAKRATPIDRSGETDVEPVVDDDIVDVEFEVKEG